MFGGGEIVEGGKHFGRGQALRTGFTTGFRIFCSQSWSWAERTWGGCPELPFEGRALGSSGGPLKEGIGTSPGGGKIGRDDSKADALLSSVEEEIDRRRGIGAFMPGGGATGHLNSPGEDATDDRRIDASLFNPAVGV